MPDVIIKPGYKVDPIDLQPIDPDRTQVVNKAPKWVVVAHALDDFRRGDLIGPEDLREGAEVDKLLSLGAIIPIESAEHNSSVSVPVGGPLREKIEIVNRKAK